MIWSKVVAIDFMITTNRLRDENKNIIWMHVSFKADNADNNKSSGNKSDRTQRLQVFVGFNEWMKK